MATPGNVDPDHWWIRQDPAPLAHPLIVDVGLDGRITCQGPSADLFQQALYDGLDPVLVDAGGNPLAAFDLGIPYP